MVVVGGGGGGGVAPPSNFLARYSVRSNTLTLFNHSSNITLIVLIRPSFFTLVQSESNGSTCRWIIIHHYQSNWPVDH